MTNPDFNASLKVLLKAYSTHQDLRKQRAAFPALAKSSHDLHQARMAAYHASLR